jgi:hypothetical protein
MKNKKFYPALLIGVISVVLLACLYLFNLFQSKPDCGSYSYVNCPESCVVCPSCEYCSSVSCQTVESCGKLGFNRSWSENINKRLGEIDISKEP